jgi:hypothetical protein
MKQNGHRWMACAAVLAAAAAIGAPATAQRLSEWSAPVNAGALVNSSAFDG